jgi:hypothetical protein
MGGVIAWGSYASRAIEDPVKDYGTPFLTVGGELDGWMARTTRIAVSFDRMRSHNYAISGLSNYTYPVVVVPGLNHASFLTGEPPKKVKETDLRAEISEAEAIEQISDVTAAFLTIHGHKGDSKELDKAKRTLDYLVNEVTAA